MTEESPVQPRGRDPIPRDELLELVEEWRESARDIDAGGLAIACREERLACAEELEALLQE